eukprot:TRINITY_DN5435_c0_g1_i4.p1 TRINITY_DN5435_c0_g1~~TRINITY_DN5435_c0_g1_i4.p1  ORF type:complete len:443 (-),score=97.90 TRINITY_DN5435_c0_g1_i4:45-1373(-)
MCIRDRYQRRVHGIQMTSKKFPEFVSYHFLNADGQLCCMEEDGLNTEKFLKEGFNVDGSSIKGMMSVEKSDLKVMPEPESYATLKIDDFVHHRFLAHLLDEDGKPHPKDPRGILKRMVDKAHSMGFEPEMFSEVEFYIVDENGKPADAAGYCALPPADKSIDFRQELGTQCKKMEMRVKRIHHECGPGQNEIELNLTPCMKNADDTLMANWIMELLAAKRNQKIIFTPKPFKEEAGNGFHHHILLRDLKTGENVLKNAGFDGVIKGPEDNMKRLSEVCKHGIAGLLKYADEITAVFAGHPETFIRLRPGFEAPFLKSWGFANRTALVRVPKTGYDLTRFEYRGGDLSYSTHMYGAILLAAVLKGIEDKLPLPPAADFNVEKLSEEDLKKHGIEPVPLSFEKCLEVLKTSKFLEETIGPEMVKHLIQRNEDIIAGRFGMKQHH